MSMKRTSDSEVISVTEPVKDLTHEENKKKSSTDCGIKSAYQDINDALAVKEILDCPAQLT